MTSRDKQSDGLIATLLGWAFTTILLTIPYLMMALLYFFKNPIIRIIELEKWCFYWKACRWIFWPAAGLACIGFAYCMYQSVLLLTFGAVSSTDILMFGFYLCACFVCALVFNVTIWIDRHCATPSFQKKLAGMQAERFVEKLINRNLPRYANSVALHGALFVFHPGGNNEFSVEVDHMVITESNIFIIETKYKSGLIDASPLAQAWKVTSHQKEDTMQNALKQVKNAVRVLERQWALPSKIVPLVAIKGKDVTLLNAPANVVLADDILKVIDAFEASKPNSSLDPAMVKALFIQHQSYDKNAMERHIGRAQAAKMRSQMAEIVETASIQ